MGGRWEETAGERGDERGAVHLNLGFGVDDMVSTCVG